MSSALSKIRLCSLCYYLAQLLHVFGHVLHGLGHVLHGFCFAHVGHGFCFAHVLHGFGQGKVGASMLLIVSAAVCNTLDGCPHVTHGFGHVLHGFGSAFTHVLLHGFGHEQLSAMTGIANITATAITKATTANFFILPPFF